MYRSSLERHNAPYRGVSSRQDVINFDLATMHDLFFIQKVGGANPSFLGHKHYIQNNLSALFTGETDVKTSMPTAGKIVHSLGPVGEQDLSKWTKLQGATIKKDGTHWKASATGNLIKAGFKTIVTVDPGDILQMRFKMEKFNGSEVKIAIGALYYDSDGDNLDIYNLDDFRSFNYVDKRLSFSSRQDVEFVIYITYETKQGFPVDVLISDFSIERLSETDVSIRGAEEDIKPLIETADLTLSFVEEAYEEGGIL